MMLLGHRTVAAPCALTLCALSPVPWPLQIIMGGIVIHSSGWNDLDHKFATASREFGFISRALSTVVRGVSYAVYLWTRTPRDKERKDAHRGFTHTIEGCLLFALTTGVVLALIPFTFPYAFWIALAAFVGTLSHLLGDMCTPSGVPLQISWKVDGMRWQRYAFGFQWHGWTIRDYPMIALPTVRVVTVGGRPGLRSADRRPPRAGLFRTDSAGEHYVAIPLIWLATGVGCLAVTGSLWPLVVQLIGL